MVTVVGALGVLIAIILASPKAIKHNKIALLNDDNSAKNETRKEV